MSPDILDRNLCCIKGCDREVLAHAMCATHGRNMRLYGSPLRTKVVQYHGLSNDDRFFKWVRKTDSCWLWKGATTPKGYGQINIRTNGKTKLITAHRYSWQVHHGPIPEGMHVCHHCDTPPCVNPDHLFLGTYEDNMMDMILKGRQPRAKLNAAQVKAIRLDTRKHEDIAKEYGVVRQTVSMLKAIRTWLYVPGEVRQHEPEPHTGEKNPASKLTDNDVKDIRASKERVNALAERYGVTSSNITAIRREDTWAHVPGPIPKVRRSPVLLTESQVSDILADPRSYAEIAVSYGVKPYRIGVVKRRGNIRKRRSWKHID